MIAAVSLAPCVDIRRALGTSLGATSGSRLHGAKFRRQVPFDRFVVDFYCHTGKLDVEPRTAIRGDGEQHEGFADYDKGRSQVLERMGIGIIRLTNDEVRDVLDFVLAALRMPFD
jgi:very-short-patch-repair endonuclease